MITRNRFLALFFVLMSSCVTTRPKIECFDPNNFASDTSYFIRNHAYSGFIFPETYDPILQLSEKRFTPTVADIELAELILKSERKYGRAYARQYLGQIDAKGDTLISIRLLKYGFREECFDKIVTIGYGEPYEKNQRIRIINLTKGKIR